MSEASLLDEIRHLLVQQNQFIAYIAQSNAAISNAQSTNRDLVLQIFQLLSEKTHKNPLNRFGNKCFSQSDEDGITLEILRRLNISEGVFVEFGVGDGLENNTLILLSQGWRGVWVGGQPVKFRAQLSGRLYFNQAWVSLDNCYELALDGLNSLGAEVPDVFSLDLDGNDIYLVRRILESGLLPSLFIVEYNARYFPPIRFQIEYNPDHRWQGDDYFGASLMSYVDLFKTFGYDLVCCNSHTGANAFFVKNKYSHLFEDVPKSIGDIYIPPRYLQFGHQTSVKTAECVLAGGWYL